MKVLFNPRCSKCRILGKELDAKEIAWESVLYLEGTLDRALVEQIFETYAGNWHDLIRTKEKSFKALGIKITALSQEEAIELVLENPVFIQRPIVFKDGKAMIARDDDAVREVLE